MALLSLDFIDKSVASKKGLKELKKLKYFNWKLPYHILIFNLWI